MRLARPLAPLVRPVSLAWLVAGALAPWAAGPALAASATPELCRALIAGLGPPSFQADAVEPFGTDGCLYLRPHMDQSTRGGYEAASLLLRGVPFDPAPGPVPSLSVQAELRGLTYVSHTGSARIDWFQQVQQSTLDVTLDAGYQADTHRIEVRSLVITGPTLGSLSLSATVDTIALTVPLPEHGPEALYRAGVSAVRLDLASPRGLSSLGLVALLPYLPSDPAPAVERLRQDALARLGSAASVPHLSAESLGALAGFVRELPNPRHALSASLTADPPVGFAEMAGTDPEALATSVLARLRGTVSYVGSLP